MLTTIVIFFAQFATIYMLGIQSLNVRDGNYLGAAITSVALGVCGFYVTNTVGQLPADAALSIAWWGYVIAGPIGICCAMRTHPTIARWLKADWLKSSPPPSASQEAEPPTSFDA